MIRKSGSRFSEKPALGPRPGGSCSNNNLTRDCPFPQISRALNASVPLGKAAYAAWTTHYKYKWFAGLVPGRSGQ